MRPYWTSSVRQVVPPSTRLTTGLLACQPTCLRTCTVQLPVQQCSGSSNNTEADIGNISSSSSSRRRNRNRSRMKSRRRSRIRNRSSSGSSRSSWNMSRSRNISRSKELCISTASSGVVGEVTSDLLLAGRPGRVWLQKGSKLLRAALRSAAQFIASSATMVTATTLVTVTAMPQLAQACWWPDRTRVADIEHDADA